MVKMVYEIDELVFVKYPKANTVNVYVGDNNVDCFTHYGIGTDFDKFEASCKEYFDYEMKEEEF